MSGVSIDGVSSVSLVSISGSGNGSSSSSLIVLVIVGFGFIVNPAIKFRWLLYVVRLNKPASATVQL